MFRILTVKWQNTLPCEDVYVCGGYIEGWVDRQPHEFQLWGYVRDDRQSGNIYHQFSNIHESIKIDFTIEDEECLANQTLLKVVNFIEDFMLHKPLLKPLVLFLKRFLSQKELFCVFLGILIKNKFKKN